MGTQERCYFVRQCRWQVIELGDIAIVSEYPPTVLERMGICDEPLSRPQGGWDVLPQLRPSLAESQERLPSEDSIQRLPRPAVLLCVRGVVV